jgi:GNAT superfamily N-acetyltransferase
VVDLDAVREAVVAGWQVDAASRPGGAVAEVGGARAHATGLPLPPWNGAFATDDGVRPEELAGWFAERGVPWGLLLPSELGLRPTGMRHVQDQPLMARPLPAPDVAVPPGVVLRTDAPATDVGRVQAAAFGLAEDLAVAFVAPQVDAPWSRFVTAYAGDVAVGSAQVVLAGASAGVYGVGVLEEHRGRGLGLALTAAVLGVASDAGLAAAHLNPSELGRGVYARLGFTDLPAWSVWEPEPGYFA